MLVQESTTEPRKCKPSGINRSESVKYNNKNKSDLCSCHQTFLYHDNMSVICRQMSFEPAQIWKTWTLNEYILFVSLGISLHGLLVPASREEQKERQVLAVYPQDDFALLIR